MKEQIQATVRGKCRGERAQCRCQRGCGFYCWDKLLKRSFVK